VVQLSRENLRRHEPLNGGRGTPSYLFVMLPCVVQIRGRKVYMVHSVQGRSAMVKLTLNVNGKPAAVSA